MEYIPAAALSVPLSVLGLLRAYNSLIVDSSRITISSYVLLLGLVAAAVKLNLSLINRHRFEARARALGCGKAPVYPHKDPILGLDSFFEGLRNFKDHTLLNWYFRRFTKCGSTYWSKTLGSWLLMTDDVENIKTILAAKFDDWPIAGPRLLGTLPVLGPDSIFSTNGAAWQHARTMIKPAFVRDQVADLQCFDRHIRNFLAAIPKDGSAFDIQELLLDMTMDSSTDFLMGYSTNQLTTPSPEARQFVEDFEFASRESSKKTRFGPILYKLPHPELEAAVKRMREYIRSYLKKAAEEKKGLQKERNYVFLDELLKLNPPEEYLIDQALTILVAGRDTTAAAITGVFYFLARHPDVVEKLRAEIMAVDEERPAWEKLKQMKYLNNVIKEALRLFTPVSTNSRSAIKETILPRGGGPDGAKPILVPKGTPIRYSLHSLHRSKDIFGPDAEEFRPERWDGDFRPGWGYLPFSGGPRICLGQQFALTQIAYTLFKFFRVFKAIEARDSQPLLAKVNLTISFPNGCRVSVTPA